LILDENIRAIDFRLQKKMRRIAVAAQPQKHFQQQKKEQRENQRGKTKSPAWSSRILKLLSIRGAFVRHFLQALRSLSRAV